MEELRSTEVLDQEILEDARKKAFKILKTADDNIQSQAKRWEKKTQKAVDEIRRSYERQTRQVQDEILARGPLDKRRLRSETAEFFLRDAMTHFLNGLERGSLLLILEQELEARLSGYCEGEIGPGEKPSITCRNMEAGETEKILRKVLAKTGSAGIPLFKDWELNAETIASSFPVIILNTKGLRITASVENAALKLLGEKRAELVSSLLGEGALND